MGTWHWPTLETGKITLTLVIRNKLISYFRTLWTPFVPQRIGRLTFAPNLAKEWISITSHIAAINSLTGNHLPSFTADIAACDAATGCTWMQIEDIVYSSLSPTMAKDDRELFFSTVWKSDTLKTEQVYDIGAAADFHKILDEAALGHLRELKANCVFRKVLPGPYQPLVDLAQRQFDANPIKKRLQNPDVNVNTVDIDFIRSLKKSIESRILSTENLDNSPILSIEQVPILSAIDRHLGSITQTLQHRFPQLSVVEIGSNLLGPSSSVRTALATTGSYVFGNISPSNSEAILETTVQLESLDQHQLDKFQKSFDLVIISFAIHGRQNIDSILSNLRTIIKPGGYLVLVEPTRDLIWLKYLLYATRPAQEQALGDAVPLFQLDQQLRSSMFSGIDHSTDYSGISVMVSQAVDNRIAALRQPLHPDHLTQLSGDVLLIGDGNFTTHGILQDTLGLLHGWRGRLVVQESLDTLSTTNSFSAVVIVNDLNMPPQSFKSTNQRRILDLSNLIIWVTLEGEFNNGVYAAIVASTRSMANQIQFQSVLIDNTWNIQHTIANSLMRLLYAKQWKLSATHLWTDEDELRIRHDKTLIPRVLPVDELNDRFNSSRRKIMMQRRQSEAIQDIVIDFTGSVDSIDCFPWARPNVGHGDSKVTIQVNYSSLLALRVGLYDYLYICIGRIPGHANCVMAFAETLSNSISVNRLWHLAVEAADESMQRTMIEMTMHYITASGINSLFKYGTAVIYEPGRLLAFVLSELVRGTDKQFLFLTSDQQVTNSQVNCTFIHPQSSRLALQSLIPKDITLFINMGSAGNQIAQRIIETVSPSCCVEKDIFFRIQSQTSKTSFIETLRLARHFVSEITKSSSQETENIINASKLTGELSQSTIVPLTIVDWADANYISLQARPLKTNNLLSSESYLLANIPVDSAEPLARWLMAGGARHIMIAER